MRPLALPNARGVRCRRATASRIRFAFRIVDGPNAGLACGSWRCWTKGEDTYLTAVTVGEVWKLSLHGDESWRYAVTAEHIAAGAPVAGSPDNRLAWEFRPTEFVDGVRDAFAVAVLRNALRPVSVDGREAVVPVDDRWDRLTVAYISMTEPGVTAEPARAIAPPLTLASGRQVWLWFRSEPVALGQPEPPPDAVIVEPMSPEKDDVTIPGVLLRGANFG